LTDNELVALGYPESSLTLAHEAVAVLLAEGRTTDAGIRTVMGLLLREPGITSLSVYPVVRALGEALVALKED
jgi:hypothetical protein